MEPDPYLKQAYQFGVLQDFDHLDRYANHSYAVSFEDFGSGNLRSVTRDLFEKNSVRPHSIKSQDLVFSLMELSQLRHPVFFVFPLVAQMRSPSMDKAMNSTDPLTFSSREGR